MISNLLHSAYSTSLFRKWQSSDCKLDVETFIYPIFISNDPDCFEDIPSLIDQKRIGVNRLSDFIRPLVDKKLTCVLLFGTVDSADKDSLASACDKTDSVISGAVKLLKKEFPKLVVACDVCLCAYTDHGHCGILYDGGRIDNETTIKRLAQIAVHYAQAGADIVAPSDMMDGRVATIKNSLRDANLGQKVAVMSYSSKFASCLYGPFRSASKSSPAFGDRRSYQLPPGAKGLAIQAAIRDANEGADFIIIKPGLFYLDVVNEIRKALPNHPLAVYHVSGEYVMLKHAAEMGTVDLKQVTLELLTSFRRAGASMIITYLTPYILDLNLTEACQ